jgi:hypothetical protein
MKNFFKVLLSDSNKLSTKRFIGLLCLLMFIAYGVAGLVVPFNLNFWIFYVSLCVITIWIAFKFMSAEKILKYDVITKLTKVGAVKEAVDGFIDSETELDKTIQPEEKPTGEIVPNLDENI